ATDFWRQQGFDGLRLDVAPELSLPFHWGNMLSGSLSGQLRETAYHLFNQNQVALVRPTTTAAFPALDKDFEKFRAFADGVLPVLDENHSRELGAIQGLVSTTFQRVYDFPHLGLGKVMHTIEPEVQYLFIPQTERPMNTVVLPSCES